MKAFDSVPTTGVPTDNATTMDQWRDSPVAGRDSPGQRPTLREEGEREEFISHRKTINEQWPAEENCSNCWRDDGVLRKDLVEVAVLIVVSTCW
jgi:hypothetical protein